MKIIRTVLGLLLLNLLILGCSKPEDDILPSANTSGNLVLNFNNVVDTSELVLDSGVYFNAFEQAFSVVKFNYIVSNFALQLEDGNWFYPNQDSCYFLIKEKDLFSHQAIIRNIPTGKYKAIKFIIGVDSLRSTRPIQELTGNIDPTGYAADMVWTWNQGYIFMKLECRPFIPKGDSSNFIPYVFHIGGYGGVNNPTINNIVEQEFQFTGTSLEDQKSLSMNLKVDLMKVLVGPNNVNFDDTKTVMLTPFSVKIAENYREMMQLESIEIR